jgi:hypothetical protein
MKFQMLFRSIVFSSIVVGGVLPLAAQQKPQWMPGQAGLNAGIMPAPGLTYANIDINYNAGTLNGPSGGALPVTSSYNVWAIENIFFGVSDKKIFGANYGIQLVFPTIATGALDADFNVLPNTSISGGGTGLADMYLQPVTLGWHLKRFDIMVADGFMIPTGRYNAGATDNVGTGYFGNHVITATTAYLTKNKATSANLFTDWEQHASKDAGSGYRKTPGQGFTMEWGLGQLLPLKKDFTQLLQIGVIGYDQWQVTASGGTTVIGPITVPANTLPFYSVHAVGGQLTYILPVKNLQMFFKYEHEYAASSHTLGNTLVFGGSWTLRHPKPVPPPKS